MRCQMKKKRPWMPPAAVGLSQSAEEAWREKAVASMEEARAADGITVVDLSPEDAAAFAEAVATVRDDYVASVDGADALAAMQGNCTLAAEPAKIGGQADRPGRSLGASACWSRLS